MKIIAHIRTDFPTKFGIPRQSGLAETAGTVVFLPEYRNPDALRGIEEFSHLWLLWDFSGAHRTDWSPTVRPPRLGGNERRGVFATRSPFRPNPIGLSCVRLCGVRHTEHEGDVLDVCGADLMDGTPLFDIKPYLPYTDAHPEATSGFAGPAFGRHLAVSIPPELLSVLPCAKRAPLAAILAEDPRPSYQDDPARVYGMPYAGYDIRFTVADGVLTVCDILPL